MRTAIAPITVATVLAQLEGIEGKDSFHHAMQYFADSSNAARARSETAKKLYLACQMEREVFVEKLAAWRAGATHCSWCGLSLISLKTSRRLDPTTMVHLACGVLHDDAMERWEAERYAARAGGAA